MSNSDRKLPESYWRLASAQSASNKASYAHFQTAETGRKKTIISVDEDEALTIYWALEDYIKKHREEYAKEDERTVDE